MELDGNKATQLAVEALSGQVGLLSRKLDDVLARLLSTKERVDDAAIASDTAGVTGNETLTVATQARDYANTAQSEATLIDARLPASPSTEATAVAARDQATTAATKSTALDTRVPASPAAEGTVVVARDYALTARDKATALDTRVPASPAAEGTVVAARDQATTAATQATTAATKSTNVDTRLPTTPAAEGTVVAARDYSLTARDRLAPGVLGTASAVGEARDQASTAATKSTAVDSRLPTSPATEATTAAARDQATTAATKSSSVDTRLPTSPALEGTVITARDYALTARDKSTAVDTRLPASPALEGTAILARDYSLTGRDNALLAVNEASAINDRLLTSPNLLSPNDSGFEVDITGWTNHFVDSATRSTARAKSGLASARLVEAAEANVYLTKNVAVVSGKTYTLSGWVYIETFGSLAVENRGLFAHNLQATWKTHPYYVSAEITAATPRGRWVHLSGTFVANNGTYNLRLYCPPGSTVYWDDIRLEEKIDPAVEGTVVTARDYALTARDKATAVDTRVPASPAAEGTVITARDYALTARDKATALDTRVPTTPATEAVAIASRDAAILARDRTVNVPARLDTTVSAAKNAADVANNNVLGVQEGKHGYLQYTRFFWPCVSGESLPPQFSSCGYAVSQGKPCVMNWRHFNGNMSGTNCAIVNRTTYPAMRRSGLAGETEIVMEFFLKFYNSGADLMPGWNFDYGPVTLRKTRGGALTFNGSSTGQVMEDNVWRLMRLEIGNARQKLYINNALSLDLATSFPTTTINDNLYPQFYISSICGQQASQEGYYAIADLGVSWRP